VKFRSRAFGQGPGEGKAPDTQSNLSF